MSFDEFNEMIRSKLSGICGKEFSVSVYEALKNNSVVHKGISIKDNDNNIAPTIYMDEFYTDYCDGRDIDDIINDILRIYSANRKGPDIETGRFADFEWVNDRIYFKVINAERNRSLLQQIPHSLKLDLALVYGVYMGNYRGSFSSVLIRNEHLKMWKTDQRKVMELAMRNTPDLLPCGLWTMKDVLKEMGVPVGETECGSPMYILSNRDRVNGAGVMFYDGILGKLADDLMSDLYILPSSVHELIAVPASEIMCPGELRDMIADVNDTQVSAEEILSYSLYEYRRKNDSIDIVTAEGDEKAATAAPLYHIC